MTDHETRPILTNAEESESLKWALSLARKECERWNNTVNSVNRHLDYIMKTFEIPTAFVMGSEELIRRQVREKGATLLGYDNHCSLLESENKQLREELKACRNPKE